MNNPARPCSVCHASDSRLVTERFADDATAFGRHAQLVTSGRAPSLCMQRDGTRNVCHLSELPAKPQFSSKNINFLTKQPHSTL